MKPVTMLMLGLLAVSCQKQNEIVFDSGLRPHIPRIPPSLQPIGAFFIEKGSDADSSYMSLKGTRGEGGALQVSATSWGIIEYGLVLIPAYQSHFLRLTMVGRCGTVQTTTWQKVTLSYVVPPDSLIFAVEFSNGRDSLGIAEAVISSTQSP